MKLIIENLPRWAFSCLAFAGLAMPAAWAQQTAPQSATNAEIRIVTRTVDANGVTTNRETVLTGQDALNYIRENHKEQPTPDENGMVRMEKEIQMIINDDAPGTIQHKKDGKTIRIEMDKKDLGNNIPQALIPNLEGLNCLELPTNGKDCQIIITKDCKNTGDRPVLGVSLNQDNESVIIEEVIEGSAAKAAGLQKGDKIVKINDQAVANIEDLQQAIRSQKVGDAIKLEYNRDGKNAVATATLKASRPEVQWKTYSDRREMMTPEEACKKLEALRGAAFLGVYINSSDEDHGGALVTNIIKGTSA
jgi:hypothetical protein